MGPEDATADRDLENRVHELEGELARMLGAQLRGLRKRATWDIRGLPAY